MSDRALLERAAMESCYKLKPPIWPFPPNGKPIPPTPQQAAQDQREELERLGDALM